MSESFTPSNIISLTARPLIFEVAAFARDTGGEKPSKSAVVGLPFGNVNPLEIMVCIPLALFRVLRERDRYLLDFLILKNVDLYQINQQIWLYSVSGSSYGRLILI